MVTEQNMVLSFVQEKDRPYDVPTKGVRKPKFQQTEFGPIPIDWQMTPLSDFGKWKGGGTPSKAKPDYWKGNIPWVSPKDMKGTSIKKTEDYITEKAIVESSTSLIPQDSLLVVTRSGILRNYVPVATNIIPVAINQDIKALAVSNLFSSAFILQSLLGFSNEIKEATVKSGTTVESIDFKAFKSFRVPVPPTLTEQRAIAKTLSDVDALLFSLNQLIDKKKAIKQGAMQQLLTCQKRLPSFSGEWETKALSRVMHIRHGKSQIGISKPDGQYPILASGGEIGRTDSFLYSKSSVLIGRKGTIDTPQYIETPFWTVDTLFYSEIKTDNSPKFIYYKFCLIDWYSYNEASGVPSLNASTIEKIESLFPPTLAEQRAIAQVLSDMDAELDTLEERLSKYKVVKQGMMQQLLTGRIRLV